MKEEVKRIQFNTSQTRTAALRAVCLIPEKTSRTVWELRKTEAKSFPVFVQGSEPNSESIRNPRVRKEVETFGNEVFLKFLASQLARDYRNGRKLAISPYLKKYGVRLTMAGIHAVNDYFTVFKNDVDLKKKGYPEFDKCNQKGYTSNDNNSHDNNSHDNNSHDNNSHDNNSHDNYIININNVNVLYNYLSKDNIYGVKLLNNHQIKGYLTHNQIRKEIVEKLEEFDEDFRLYEISSEFANFNFNLLKLISNLFIRIDIKENKGYYYVIATKQALDGLNMSYLPSRSLMRKNGLNGDEFNTNINYNVSFKNTNKISNNIMLNNLFITNYIKDKSIKKYHNILNEQWLIDRAYSGLFVPYNKVLEYRGLYNSDYQINSTNIEYLSDKLLELSSELFEEVGSLDLSLTSQKDWNSIFAQIQEEVDELREDLEDSIIDLKNKINLYNDIIKSGLKYNEYTLYNFKHRLFEKESELEELNKFQNTLNWNYSKFSEFVFEDNYYPSESELEAFAPSKSWRKSHYKGKSFKSRNKQNRGDKQSKAGKTALEIMEDIGSVKLPINSKSSPKPKKDRFVRRTVSYKKNPRFTLQFIINKTKEDKEYIKQLCKELDTPKEEGNEDFNEIPISPSSRREYITELVPVSETNSVMVVPLPNKNGVMHIPLQPTRTVMVRKVEKPIIKGFSLPNKEALIVKFKKEYYTGVIHQYISKTLSYYKQKERQKYKIIRRTVSYKKDPRFTLRFKIRRVKGVKTPKTLHKSEWKYNNKQKKVQQALANREALKTVIKHRMGEKVVNTFTPLSNFKITIKGGEL